jgi:hypothetical protein
MTHVRQKKSESLEVRLSHEAKGAFMQKASQSGHSASEIVRDFVDRYVAERPHQRNGHWRLTALPAAAVLAFAVSAFVPPAHHAENDLRPTLNALVRRQAVVLDRRRFSQMRELLIALDQAEKRQPIRR